MTFSLVARDPRTGAFGMVVSSSSPAVASRCIHLRSGVGVVASQNVTNPALGPLILDGLEAGKVAPEALNGAIAQEAHPDYRQLSVIDSRGGRAHHSGPESLGINHIAESGAAIAAGNLLKSQQTIDSLLAGYLNSSAEQFEEQLLEGLSLAMNAGGEAGPVRSAGIKVVEDYPWPTTDLRVDDAAEPIGELNRLWQLWQPQKQDYIQRALDPTEAPSYGVLGDE